MLGKVKAPRQMALSEDSLRELVPLAQIKRELSDWKNWEFEEIVQFGYSAKVCLIEISPHYLIALLWRLDRPGRGTEIRCSWRADLGHQLLEISQALNLGTHEIVWRPSRTEWARIGRSLNL